MAKIEGFRVKNFKSLKDVTVGRLWSQPQNDPLTPMTAVIGKNGVGKSALFDTFGFLADALKSGVEEACDARGRGGFEKLRTQGQTAPIEFEVCYKASVNVWPIIYRIEIEADESGRPYVLSEVMLESEGKNRPLCFLMLFQGAGWAWKGTQAGRQVDETAEGFDLEELFKSIEKGKPEEFKDAETIDLEDPRKIGIAHLVR